MSVNNSLMNILSSNSKNAENLENNLETKDVIPPAIILPSVFLPGILSAPLARLIGAFLDDITHAEFAKGNCFSAGACDEDVDKRRAVRVKEELLRYVFSGRPDAVEKFLKQDGVTPLAILTKVDFDEGYFSEQLKEFVRFRFWPSVSPLQAAACTGDKFILEILLKYIEEENGLKRDAILQLEAVQQGISDQKLLLEAIDTLLAIEYGEKDTVKQDAQKRLEEITSLQAFQDQMDAFMCEMKALCKEVLAKKEGKENVIVWPSCDTSSDRKPNADTKSAIDDRKSLTEERKKTDENTSTILTGDTEFLSAVIKLLQGYVYYCIYRIKLKGQNDSGEIEYFWQIVGECHKRVYEYIKQEFCDEKPFSLNPLPDFTTSPRREDLRFFNGRTLDLDIFGFGTLWGFYKGPYNDGGVQTAMGCGMVVVRENYPDRNFCGAHTDANAIAHLYKLRLTGLNNTIKKLKSEFAKTIGSANDSTNDSNHVSTNDCTNGNSNSSTKDSINRSSASKPS